MFKKIIITMISILVFLNLSSCAFNKKISEISILENSFKLQYLIDEEIDYSRAKLLVYYENNSRQVIPITENMIEGFDTSIASLNKVMTITYNGYSTIFMYSVSGDATSSARVIYEFKNDVFYLKLRPNGDVKTIAIRLELYTKDEDVTISQKSAKHDIVVDKVELRTSVVVFARDGITPIEGVFLEIKENLSLEIKENLSQDITIKNILISDGYLDYSLPDIVLSRITKK